MAVLVTLGVIAAIAAGIATILQRSDPSLGPLRLSWNAIVTAERASGAFTVLDPEGAILTEADGSGRITAIHTHRERLALVGAGRVTLVGLDGEDPVEIDVDPSATLRRHLNARIFTLILASDAPGEITVIEPNHWQVMWEPSVQHSPTCSHVGGCSGDQAARGHASIG
jgi:hypothetical protein